MMVEYLKSLGFTAVDIPLSRGLWGTVDIEDAPSVLVHRWFAWRCPTNRTFYVMRNLKVEDGANKRGTIRLHRFFLQCGPTEEGDHRDGNGLNNRRSNLRTCLRRENAKNQQLAVTNRSGFKGVHFCNTWKRWIARIHYDSKMTFLGHFKNPVEAAMAYDEAAKKYHGQFARLNFPTKG
jgi:hypothetical protein